jgi:TP901 family phage tail tape measure protein
VIVANRTVSVTLLGKGDSLVGMFRDGAKGAQQFGQELDGLGKRSPKSFNDIALAAGGVGLALTGIAGYAVKAAMAFDKQMSEVAAVSNATGKDLVGLRAAALQAGKDTAFSATEAAKAEAELAKAGISTADIMGGALKGSLSLAAAGQMDLADAATIAAQTMNIFGLQGKDVTHIADVLASAANVSAADMHGLGQGLQQVGLVAHQAGWSLEQTTGVLAAFADRGLQGSDGATSLKTALQRLQNPTKEASAMLEQLGIEVYDQNGHFVDAVGLAGQLQARLGHLSEAERNSAFGVIFGSDAIRAANVLYATGSVGIERYTKAVDQNGAAAETARKKMDNLAGDIEQLRGSLETLAITSGTGANSGLRVLAQSATGLVNAIGSLPAPLASTLTVLSGVGGVTLLAAAGFLKVRQTVRDTLDALREMGPAGEKAAAGLSRVGSVLGRGSAIAAGVLALYEGFTLLGKWIDTWNAPIVRDVEKMSAALKEFASTGRTTGELAKTFGPQLGSLAKDINDVAKSNEYLAKTNTEARKIASAGGKGGGSYAEVQADITRKSVLQQREDLKALDQAFASLATSGGVTQAKVALSQLSAATGKPVSELLALMPKYREALDGAAAANSGAAKGFGDVAANARTLGESMESAVASGQKLTDVLGQLSGGHASFIQAEINAKNAVDDMSKALKDSSGSLDINTEKGRAAMQTVLGLREAAIKSAEAKYEETGSVGAASKVWDSYTGQLRKAMHDAGATDAQIDTLIGDLFRMPPSVTSRVDLPGVAGAINDAAQLRDVLRGLQGTYRASVITTYLTIRDEQTGQSAGPRRGVITAQRWGGITEHAADGLLRDAAMYSPTGPARYAFAEPSTGGEAFVPKFGDYARSTQILDRAARWYGGRFAPAGAGGAVRHEHVVVIQEPSGRRLGELLIQDGQRGGAIATYIKRTANR